MQIKGPPNKAPPPPPPPKKSLFAPVALLAVCAFCIWFVYTSLIPILPKEADPPRLYSNQSQQDLRLMLVEAIRQSKNSIELVMFGLSDPAILSVLMTKLRQNIAATIYYDPKGSPNVQKMLPKADIHPVRQSGLMHQKILIVDDETVFLGSANMTSASLRMHDNLIVGMKNRKVAKFLTDRIPSTSGYLRTMVGGQEIELWLLPDPRGHALNDLRKKLRGASQSIQAALFTFTHPLLVEELINAQKRGVEVTVVVDMHSSLGASSKAVDQLKKSGVRILSSQGVQLLHHKFVFIDGHMLLCGSANWTKAAFYKNSDCFIALHNMNAEQKSFMTSLWNRIESEARAPKKY